MWKPFGIPRIFFKEGHTIFWKPFGSSKVLLNISTRFGERLEILNVHLKLTQKRVLCFGKGFQKGVNAFNETMKNVFPNGLDDF
jgi:hypothetical protein